MSHRITCRTAGSSFPPPASAQSRAVLVDEGKPQFAGLDEDGNEPAFVLHVMNGDGSDIHQVSFNQSHDLDPDRTHQRRGDLQPLGQRGSSRDVSLYQMHPGRHRGLQLLYGAQQS